MLAAPVVIVLTLASTTNLVLSCSPSSDITEIQDIRLCNGSTLSIKFNVSDSCNNIIANLYVYLYHHNTSSGGTARSHVSWEYSHYSDVLCGVTARLDNPVIIDVDEFNRINLLQIRLRELSGNEICSNNFHVFLDDTGFLGPPVNINSYSYNCSTINVTWSEPDVNCGNPVKYNLSIYDDITDQFLRNVSLDGTSYQFVDEDLFRHRYTYVISADNDLNEGISINDTFSYQRVPNSAMEHTTLDVLNYTQDMATVEYNIPVVIECTGEAPENATVTIQCNGTGVVFQNTELIEYEQPNNITGLISVSQYQQCILNVTFSNGNGSSEPFILAFNTTPPPPPYVTSSLPTVSVTLTSGPTYTSSSSPTVSVAPTSGPASDTTRMTMVAIISIAVGIVAVVIVVLIGVLVPVGIHCKRKYCTGSVTLNTSTSHDAAKSENDSPEIELTGVGNDGLGQEEVVSDGAAGQKGGVTSVVQAFDAEKEEVVRNNGAEQEVVEQNPMTEQEAQDDTTKKDTTVAQEDGHDVKQGIAIIAEVHDSNTTASLVQDPVPEPKEVAQNDMTEKESAIRQDEVLVDNADTATSKSNDKEIESAENASNPKKPSKDKYHKDTYNPKRQLLDQSSSVIEPSVDYSEYNAYYDEPEVPDEAGHKETETTDDDQQQPRQFVTHSIPRPIAGHRSSVIISGATLLTVLPKENEPQAESPSSKKESTDPQQIANKPNPQINEGNKDFQSEPFDNSTIL